MVKIFDFLALLFACIAMYMVLEETNFATKTGNLISFSSLFCIIAIAFWLAGEVVLRKRRC